MLKKINRGLKRRDFDELKIKGKIYQSPLFGMAVVDGSKEIKLATIISKKISKKAVVRNKIRRRLFEAARKNFDLLKENKFKIVFLVKKTILDKSYEEINSEINKIFLKLNNDKS